MDIERANRSTPGSFRLQQSIRSAFSEADDDDESTVFIHSPPHSAKNKSRSVVLSQMELRMRDRADRVENEINATIGMFEDEMTYALYRRALNNSFRFATFAPVAILLIVIAG